VCGHCLATDVSFEPVSVRAHLWSYTVTHHRIVKGFEDIVPYVCLVVELVEQPGLFMASDLPGEMQGLRLGMPMCVTFELVDANVVLPQFRPS
jgi:uncharacterized OB-fold protein